MSMARVLAVALRLMLQIARDRRASALILFVPILIMSLLTVLLRTEEKPPRIALKAQGTASLFVGNMERRLESPEGEDRAFSVVPLAEGMAPEEAVRQGLADAVLVFPLYFVEERADGRRSTLNLYVDGSDPAKTSDIFSTLRKILPDSLAGFPILLPEDCDPHCADTIPTGPPLIEITKLYGRNVKEMMDFFTPALPPFFAFFFVFLLSGLTFLRERVSGTAERILASPMRRAELVAGYVAGFLPAAFVQTTLVILFARFALGGPWGGWAVIAAILLLTLVAECLGVFISAFARTEFQMIQFIPIVVLPQVLLCGMIWPIEGMPAWLKPFAYCLPLTYAVSAVRDAAIRGFSFVQVCPDLAVLAGFAAATLALAATSVKRVV